MQDDNKKIQSSELLKGPGIMWVNSKITKSEELSQRLFRDWYDQVHIPDVLTVEGIVAGWRYESKDKEDGVPYLAIYSIPELEAVQKNIEFKSVPHHHEMLHGGDSIHSYAKFDTRFYKRIQTYEKENSTHERLPTLVSEVIDHDTKTAAEFESWYREEYFEQLSQSLGWHRSTSYELLLKGGSKGEYSNVGPRWLVVHEYGNELNQEENHCARVFKLCSKFGETNAPL